MAPEDTVVVLKFEEHRRIGLPVVLRGESSGVSETKQKDAEDPKDTILDLTKDQGEEEQTKKPEAEAQTLDPPKRKNPEAETKTSEPPKKQNPADTPGKEAKQIGEPITYVTPLQSAQENIEEG